MPEVNTAESDPSDAVFRTWLFRLAAHGINQLSSRTAVAMQSMDMLRSLNPSPLSIETIEIITDTTDGRRVETSPGPYVFASVSKTNRAVLDMTEYLLSANHDVRRAAIAHLQRVGKQGWLTRQNQNLFSSELEAISSENDGRWRRAATAIYDSVQND